MQSNATAKSRPTQQNYFFHLVGGQKTLPVKEITTILTGIAPYKLLERKENCVVVQCTQQAAAETAFRAAYCRRAVQLLTQGTNHQTPTKDALVRTIGREIDFSNTLTKGQSYAVRVHKSTRGASKINTTELEAQIGNSIWQQTKKNNKANLESPDVTFIVLLVPEGFFFGREIYARPSGYFSSRRPDQRPFFKPGTLEPRFARVLANLSGVQTKRLLFDPFCGPGGILVEGALMGCSVLGMDIDETMLRGAKKNLHYYAPTVPAAFLRADARALPLKRGIEAIATDPPYGRSTSTFGKKIEQLLKQFFQEVGTVLAPNGTVAIGMYKEVPLQRIVAEAGFSLTFSETIYIHRSLTRRIGVCKKK